MQKLKSSILDSMIEKHLTGKEIDFIVCYLSRFQNRDGMVSGVHYKSVCDAIDISVQSFYDIKESLEKKEIIKCRKMNRTDYDITILNNSNRECLDALDGYINTNHNIFFTKEFKELKAGAKLLAIYLMKRTFSGKGHFAIRLKRFYDLEEGYPKRFGVSRRVMRTYLMSLKTLFSIEIKKGMYHIVPKKAVYKKSGEISEEERFREYGTNVVLRRNRIKECGEGKKEIGVLFRQYGPSAEATKRNLVDLVDQAVKRSLEIINEGEAWIRKRIINIKLVHKLLKEALLPGDGRTDRTDTSQLPHRGSLSGQKSLHAFPEREYDYDELERMLLNTKPALI